MATWIISRRILRSENVLLCLKRIVSMCLIPMCPQTPRVDVQTPRPRLYFALVIIICSDLSTTIAPTIIVVNHIVFVLVIILTPACA